jgi:hypothetical protein
VRGDARWDETWHRLLEWTAGQGSSERLSAQILLDQRFQDLDPSHPLGGKDAGADAVAVRAGKRWVMASYFPRGQQPFGDLKDKFIHDFEGVAKNEADGMAFVTNQELRRSERRNLAKAVGGPVRIYHLERLVTVLDQPRMHAVREQFLSIPAGHVVDAAQRLDELWRASLGRCATRWIAVGLTRDEAHALAGDRTVGQPAAGLVPGEEQPVVVWTAPMGSGKSIAAERHHQATLEAGAATGAESPVPVFLPAAECVPSLQRAVETAAQEIGPPRQRGVHAVVDGIDEVGHQVAGQLLTQARVLAETWPNTTVLLTSRPVSVLNEAAEHRTFPSLDDEQQAECVATGAGAEVAPWALHLLPEPVRATLGQPFFALLAGVWMRERAEAPRAPIDLMVMLGERAMRGVRVAEEQLRGLAVQAVARDLAPVPPGEVLAGDLPDDLLASGMVVQRANGLAFVLPALAQWFAAQALLRGEITAAALLDAPEDLELGATRLQWRFRSAPPNRPPAYCGRCSPRKRGLRCACSTLRSVRRSWAG